MRLGERAIDQFPQTQPDPLRVVGIGPFLQPPHQAVFDRVGVYVAAQVQKMRILIDLEGFVGTFEQRPAVAVALIVGFAVAVKDTLGQQAHRELAILTHKPMIMIGHQAVSDEGEVKFFDILLDLAQGEEVIILFAEDRFAMGATIVDVVETTGNELGSIGVHRIHFALRCDAL